MNYEIEIPWNILIIDAHSGHRREIRQMLLLGSDRPYNFTEYALGKRGFAAIPSLSPDCFDCILLGVSLPDMDVLEWLIARLFYVPVSRTLLQEVGAALRA